MGPYLLFSAILLGICAAQKPDQFFKICRRSDPKLNDCIKESLMAMKMTMKSGIPALKIPSIDPMIVTKVEVKQGAGPVSIDSTFIDLKIHGISKYQIETVKADLKNYKIDVLSRLPYLYNEGKYKINGRVLVLPIVGSGDSWSNYTDVTLRSVLMGTPVNRGGKMYLRVDDFKQDLTVGKATIFMDNLFNGNKELGDAMNRFMSENWEAVFKELKPVVDQSVGAILKNVAEKVFNKFPIDQLFPE